MNTRPFNATGLGRVIRYAKEYWSMIVGVIFVAAWMQTQYMLDLDTRNKVAEIPARTMQLITCQRHHPNGAVYIDLSCLTAIGDRSAIGASMLGAAPNIAPPEQTLTSTNNSVE